MHEREVLLPPALHAMTLTVEGAQKMREVLDDESKPGYQGREMPTADASVLLKKQAKIKSTDPEAPVKFKAVLADYCHGVLLHLSDKISVPKGEVAEDDDESEGDEE